MILSTPDLSPTTSFRCTFQYFLLVILQKFSPGRFTAGSPPLASIDEEVVFYLDSLQQMVPTVAYLLLVNKNDCISHCLGENIETFVLFQM